MTSAPNAFLVGAPKCGTTTMVELLAQHPDIFVSPVKEPDHYNPDLIHPGAFRDRAAYLALFEGGRRQRVRLDASVWYLYSTEAATRICDSHPDARILIMLRNPVAFMHSLHSQLVFNGDEPVQNFEAALAMEQERREMIERTRDPMEASRLRRLLYRQLGNYAPYVQRYVATFGNDRVHVELIDDLRTDPTALAHRVFAFFGVDATFEPASTVSNPNKTQRSRALARFLRHPAVQGFAAKVMPDLELRRRTYARIKGWNARFVTRRPLSTKLKGKLLAELSPGIDDLESLIGRDLSAWKPPGPTGTRHQPGSSP